MKFVLRIRNWQCKVHPVQVFYKESREESKIVNEISAANCCFMDFFLETKEWRLFSNKFYKGLDVYGYVGTEDRKNVRSHSET